jgi:uncharacterized protein YqgV (UPF0045/DUF77 family)
MSQQINLAIQVLPLGISKEKAYSIIDEAILQIQHSGLHYEVCPFETVIEGEYETVMNLVDEIQNACNKAGAEEVLINMKLHRNFTKDMNISDKTGKYKTS